MPNLFAHVDGLYGFSAEEVDAIYAAGNRKTFAAGDLIVERGQPGDTMFILLEGEIEIELGFQEILVARETGDYFGELSFLHPGHLRSATIRAVTDSKVCVLGQEVIDPLYRQHPSAVLNLFRRTCAFLIDSEESLLETLTEKHDALTRSYDYLRRTREELNLQEVLAQTDDLTGLYNRRCLTHQLERMIGDAEASQRGFALLMIDMDGFKAVNDLFGHPTGDELLRQVAAEIRGCIRSEDLPCRYGGDEFAVLLYGVEQGSMDRRAEEIRASISRLPEIRPGAPRVSASVGGALYRAGDSIESMLVRADEHLYLAKTEGRNRVVWRC
jgi:diguanylate cyclase (GGDEF)-like protein